jgi:hypothetical protein
MSASPRREKRLSYTEAVGKVEHSMADAEGLLNTLMLLAALLLAFAITLLTGTFSHEDLLEADERYLAYQFGKEGLPRDHGEIPSAYMIVSYRFLIWGQITVALLTMALLVGALSYVSLMYSNAREDAGEFEMWFTYFRWVIAIAYLFFIVAVISFFWFNHTAIDMSYPWYTGLARNATTGKFTEDPYRCGQLEAAGEGPNAKLHQNFSIGVFLTVLSLTGTLLLFTLTTHFTVLIKRSKQRSASDTNLMVGSGS